MRIILSILLLSFIYPRRDCLKQAETDALGRSTRPDKHTHAVSDSGYFYIWYDTTGSAAPDLIDLDSNNIPDYIDEVGIIADSAYHVLVNIMEFSAHPADEDGFYDIYIESFPSGVYGYSLSDSPSQNISGATSYLKIDNDYVGFDSQFNLMPLQIMRLSVAHEYFHGVQRAYEINLSANTYFLEMTSTWFEDVLIPDGNDYLDGFADPLLHNPTADFDKTGNGYELALFGHYLSSFLDPKGLEDVKNSTIIREMLERCEYTSSNAFYAVEYVLENNYNVSFIETWVDFMSRNLYNGLYGEDEENPFYYYSDQALIDPIQTNLQTLQDSDTLVLSLDNKSAAIQSYHLGESSFLGFEHLSADYVGRFSIVSTTDYNDLYWAADISGLELTSNSDIHFVYGSETQESVAIDIMYLSNPYIYSLVDINPNSSATYGETLSPGYFENQITLHYFGHQN